MVGENGVPATPDWDLSAWLHQRDGEAMPLLWAGDDS